MPLSDKLAHSPSPVDCLCVRSTTISNFHLSRCPGWSLIASNTKLQDEIMEITSQLTPGYTLPSDATAPTKLDAPTSAKVEASAAAKSTEARLDQLQDAMRSLPDVDMEKVAAAKQALLRGDINTDTAALASSILSYHRGSDV